METPDFFANGRGKIIGAENNYTTRSKDMGQGNCSECCWLVVKNRSEIKVKKSEKNSEVCYFLESVYPCILSTL